LDKRSLKSLAGGTNFKVVNVLGYITINSIAIQLKEGTTNIFTIRSIDRSTDSRL
jgi:hypothetical protein